ncbi:DsbA family protein [Paenibacillus macerans]|uniref:DsbA family protein n=1 Tax=Paenibacillus macerans TaxID=44252 RepID=UPI000EDD9D24|nr:thioredoxin domain-containing protein [Paenibacillus macerans]GBK63807.1 disulfide bond formation protein DsbB [Paenibacillus macerans]GBK70120.1 disulfide bond formation protein DsbB [Paenibacillus macerans]
MIQQKAGKQPKVSNRTYLLLIVLLSLAIIALAVIFLKDSAASANLNDLPNYTEIKGKFVAEGLKYEKQPHLGSPDAKVKVMEFADFKCPACKTWEEENMERFQKDFIDTGKVELFFTNFPFIDRDSIMAASAGEAIFAQSNEKFWEFKRELYANQGKESEIWATSEFLLDFVKNNIDGIDYERFAKDLKDRTYMLPVKEDFKTAGYYGVNGTPQFMVNGELLPSSSYEDLVAAIEAQLSTENEQP